MPDRGLKQAAYTVLVKTTMPAVLTECGFMDNKVDRLLMESDTYRQECANEISQGILEYLGIPFKPMVIDDSNWLDILKKVSPWANVWEDFVKDHPEVNLKGLIEKLYKRGC